MIPGLLAVLVAAAAVPSQGAAQDAPQWRPPTTEMPQMPTQADLQGDWRGSLGAWFRGLEGVTGASTDGLRAIGSARGSTARTQIARFMQGPIPVMVITDRNNDERADMIEIFRSGRMVIQVIDADYNGRANVMRVYDDSGGLLREDRL